MTQIIILSFFAIFITFLLSIALTPYMAISTLAYFLLLIGLVFRQSKVIHARLMLMGLILDISIVLILEFTREAINTALSMSLSPLQQIHILFSTIALLLYFPIIFLGIDLYRNGSHKNKKKYHQCLGVIALIFRSLGFLFMFSMIQSK